MDKYLEKVRDFTYGFFLAPTCFMHDKGEKLTRGVGVVIGATLSGFLVIEYLLPGIEYSPEINVPSILYVPLATNVVSLLGESINHFDKKLKKKKVLEEVVVGAMLPGAKTKRHSLNIPSFGNKKEYVPPATDAHFWSDAHEDRYNITWDVSHGHNEHLLKKNK